MYASAKHFHEHRLTGTYNIDGFTDGESDTCYKPLNVNHPRVPDRCKQSIENLLNELCLIVTYLQVVSPVSFLVDASPNSHDPVCGILGLLLHDPNTDSAPEICEGLSLLQHRGQDACGIVTCGPKGRFYQCKANGMVRDIFDNNSIARLIGGMGVGHGHFSSVYSRRPTHCGLQFDIRLLEASTTLKLSHSMSIRRMGLSLPMSVFHLSFLRRMRMPTKKLRMGT